ncbi:MAG: hypothetical protein K1V88_04240 [Muribaculaceae bacterium]
MRRVFLFNPENDIALGSGMPRLTPPRQAALLHRAGAMLPFWLGAGEDSVVVANADLREAEVWRDELRARHGIAGPSPVADLRAIGEARLSPWGWSLDAVSQFERLGIDRARMAAMEETMGMRRGLSHRRSSLEFLGSWRQRGNCLPYAMPLEAKSVTEVEELVGEWGTAFVKSPWSSSGRGVFPVSLSTLGVSLPRVEGVIRRQGSVMVEPELPRLQDFAMLFDYAGGEARFEGYSLFFNSTATNYGGNYVGSDDMIVDKLEQWLTRRDVEQARDEALAILPLVLGNGYEGPLGVDMMVCGDGGSDCWIAPCVEINLRYTMGFVARGVWSKLEKEGVMSVSPCGAGLAVTTEKGEGPVWLAPRNDWFDFLFRPYA